jgi:trans-aconitate methyltransferase
MAAKNSTLLKDANGVPCNTTGSTTSQQFACAVTAMAGAMNSYVTADATKLANLLAALNAQSATAVSMPFLKADGTMSMQLADMTSSASMQTALQNAGMTVDAAANTVNVMMGGMH